VNKVGRIVGTIPAAVRLIRVWVRHTDVVTVVLTVDGLLGDDGDSETAVGHAPVSRRRKLGKRRDVYEGRNAI
jgi:hypothetical protein